VQTRAITDLGGTPGGGPPVVCLHGFTGTADSWRTHVGALGRTGRVFALTLPGHGPHSPVAEGFDTNVAWIAGQIAAADLAGCHLVGYSLGARAALGVAVRHANIAASLTLIGASPGLVTSAQREQRRAADGKWIDLLRHDGIAAFVDAWQDLPIFDTQTREHRAAQRAARLSHDPEGLARSLEQMGLAVMPDYRPSIGDIAVPTRLVTGDRDDKFMALADEIAPMFPDSDRVVVAACGHNVLIESETATWL
jgi:2-succinyl-6-hydroxy-2,4-cyclohexadiene-1-carboxylate synthase